MLSGRFFPGYIFIKVNLTAVLLYSDMVINSGMFTLETAESYPAYFSSAKTGSESIWLIPFNLVDDQLEGCCGIHDLQRQQLLG